MNTKKRLAGLAAAFAAMVLALGLAACGGDDDSVGGAETRRSRSPRAVRPAARS